MTDESRRVADHTNKRRTVDHIRQDVASAARSLSTHAERVGRLRAEGRLNETMRALHAEDLKAEAEFCSECERVIIKFFNSAIRKARKELP